MSSFETLQYEESNGVGILTINRPDKLNALNATVLKELKSFLSDAVSKKISGLILTGAGDKAFVAGADIAAMTSMSASDAVEFGRLGQTVTMMMEYLPYPVIAAVNGFALGGGFEMALACDFIFASEKAVFGLPEVKLGLIPGFGGTQRLARRTHIGFAKELVFSGRNMNAQEARDRGLVQKMFYDNAELLKGSKEFLEGVAKNSPLAIGMAKKVMDQGMQTTLEQGLGLEVNAFSQLFNSQDMKEGTAAFLAKRPAVFKGE
ncbi:MAG: enoyl-CoA hydratase/isomerase family protein [Bacteriovoracaceae bacterium]|nr:enoyl-CoA hydratase/isomerase family protein [Bacteriovoracaceae bacterium]